MWIALLAAGSAALTAGCATEVELPEELADTSIVFEGASEFGPSDLLALINEKMAVEHFDLWPDEGLLVFRQTILLRGAAGVSVEQLEDLFEIAVTECERFYPAFHQVVWGGKDASAAVLAAMIDTAGEA